jgi:hypothetical protein
MTTDLHARLLSLADQSTPEGRALIAVLNRHAPDEVRWRPRNMPDGPLCSWCADEDVTFIGADMQMWPCPTVLDIAQSFNVEMAV